MQSRVGTTGTHPLESSKSVTIRTLQVEVASGPDVGRRVEAPEDRVTVGTALGNDLVLTDPTVSRFHLELTMAEDGVLIRDLGSRNGTWLAGAALERARVPLGSTLDLGRSQLRILDGTSKDVDVHRAPAMQGLLGADPQMRRLMGTIQRVAPRGVSVLVTGESGTGKELVARALHDLSERAGKPFVVVDCGALTPTLVASALFGHERGAFTGADKKHIGAFERAHGGTVFLDEIGELPLALQPQLLGVLERKRFLRLGSSDEVNVDVRILGATNRDLRSEVNRGVFREDLYYRLATVTLEVPPLRERKDDIPMLLEHFMREAGSTAPLERVFPSDVVEQLRRHRWPGNVRELRNVVEATLAMGELPQPRSTASGGQSVLVFGDDIRGMTYGKARSAVLDAFELDYLTHLMGTGKGSVSSAARLADMDRSYLIKLLQKHHLK
jgi:DNA-binding NtrC family response regulator